MCFNMTRFYELNSSFSYFGYRLACEKVWIVDTAKLDPLNVSLQYYKYNDDNLVVFLFFF